MTVRETSVRATRRRLFLVILLVAFALASDVGAQVAVGVIPGDAPAGATITILGADLDLHDVVVTFAAESFDRVEARFVERTQDSIDVVVPGTAVDGYVEILDGGSLVGRFDFDVTADPVFVSAETIVVADRKHDFLKEPSGSFVRTADGMAFLADTQHHQIRAVAADGSVSVIAGTGKPGFSDGSLSKAQFDHPTGIAFDRVNELLYVADGGNHAIRVVRTDGTVSTVAGAGKPGLVDGLGGQAQFHAPSGLAIDSEGNLYVGDSWNHAIRRVTPDGEVTTIAGTISPGLLDGPSAVALFNHPQGVGVYETATETLIFVADTGNHVIRMIRNGAVTTIAGAGHPGHVDGPSSAATLKKPAALTIDEAGNLFVADAGNNVVRKVSIRQGHDVSTVAGSGRNGLLDGLPLESEFKTPSGVAFAGALVVTDTGNDALRMIVPELALTTLYPGSAWPGSVVRVYGSGFIPGATLVSVGGIQVTFEWVSSTQLRFIVPEGLAGPSNLTVTTPSGSASLPFTAGPALISLEVSPSLAALLLGETASLMANGSFADSTVVNLTTDVSWTSSDEDVATVDVDGTITAVAVGNATIRASFVGLSDTASISVTDQILPPDPSTIASEIDSTVPTNPGESTRFLWEGADAIQTGVLPGTIDVNRAAILRGRVLTTSGTPLSGVAVRALGAPELGETLSRTDGGWDFVANGGGPVTVKFEKDGYLPVHRQLSTPWNDFVVAEDVVMTALDGNVSTIQASSPIMQTARGSVMTDADGTRRATVLFRPGTTISLVFPNGLTQNRPSISVRATEYTVGPQGPFAMPAALPAASGYTYCVELSADEAIAAGATHVRFSQPVVFYLENFIGFPVGSAVPQGWYDRERGVWIAEKNGLVIQITTIEGGGAQLDTDGDGVAENSTTLAALGITNEELQRLGVLYAAGTSLWRTEIPHFTPWDHNWPYGPPLDAEAPENPEAARARPIEGSSCLQGSIIDCQNLGLGEAAQLQGTGLALRYSSRRVPGTIENQKIKVPLTPSSIPSSLEAVEVTVSFLGALSTASFAPAPDLEYVVTVPSEDVYGRPFSGQQRARVTINYVYDLVYQTPATFAESFARLSGTSVTLTRGAANMRLRQEYDVDVFLGHNAKELGFGGWELDAHHTYDVRGGTLFMGNGDQLSALGIGRTIDRIAGQYDVVSHMGDGGPATDAGIEYPIAIATASDGTVYVADGGGPCVVRRVSPNGVIDTYAGTPYDCRISGDGFAATSATLYSPLDLAVGPDDTLYIADWCAIRHIDKNGIIRTVAGTGVCGTSGDGAPATLADINNWGIDVDDEGSLWIAGFPLRRVDRKGTIESVGGIFPGFVAPEGVPVVTADTRSNDVAVGPDGSVYLFSNRYWSIRRISPSGLISTWAGGGSDTLTEGMNARDFGYFGSGFGLVVDDDGAVYVSDFGWDAVLRVDSDRRLFTAAGGLQGTGTDGILAVQSAMRDPYGIDVAPDGSLVVADSLNRVARRVLRAPASLTNGEVAVASGAGAVFIFDEAGRHLRTVDATTGLTLLTFGYDASNRLVSVTDIDGNITSIVRDANGLASAVVAPGGQQTTLAYDENGWLESIANANGEANRFTYATNGLMQMMRTPKNQAYSFTYFDNGKLYRDNDPAGGSQTLSRTGDEDDFAVSITTAEGRTRKYEVQRFGERAIRRSNTNPWGGTTVTTRGEDAIVTTSFPDGSVSVVEEAPDPRFGMRSPFAKNVSLRMPSGLTSSATMTRELTLDDPSDLLSLQTQTDSLTSSGHTWTSTWDAALRRARTTSPLGRSAAQFLDAEGRLVRAEVPGIAATTMSYDTQGRLRSMAQGSRSWTFGWDAKFRLASVEDPLQRIVSFIYDDADRLVSQTLSDGRVMGFDYDANGNVTTVTPPGRPGHTFSYTAVDLEDTYDPPDVAGVSPDTTRYVYDLDRDLTQVIRPDGKTIDLGYDTGGRLQTIDTDGRTLIFGYDSGGSLKTLSDTRGPSMSYSWDGFLPTGVSWAGDVAGSIAWTWDNDFKVTSESVNGDPVSYGYDADNLLSSAGAMTIARDVANGRITGTSLGGVTDNYQYDSFGQLAVYSASYNGSEVFRVEYTRDDIGRITTKAETRYGVTLTEDYGYDLAGRLETVTRNGGLVSTYTYDANGNRLSHMTPTSTTAGTYDDQDRLLTYGDATYTYTDNGELLTKTDSTGTTTYDYDTLGNLRRVDLPDDTVIEYVIDAQNRRVGKKVNGVLERGWLYGDQLNPIAELDGSGTIDSTFVYGTRFNVPDYMIREGNLYRIISDHLGSVRYVVDASNGSNMQTLDFDEFGNSIIDSNPSFQPFGFGGALNVGDKVPFRFGARDYDPIPGMFTSKDPILFGGGGTSLYQYALNDPINLIDPTGETPWGVIFAGGDLAIQLYLNDGNWGCVNWAQVGFNLVGGGLLNAVAKGAFRFKTIGSRTWPAVRSWMNRRGIQMIRPGQHRHHWLFERNQGIGATISESVKNQPWNTNPISASFNSWLSRYPSLAWLGGPSWAAEVVGGTTLAGSSVAVGGANDCQCR